MKKKIDILYELYKKGPDELIVKLIKWYEQLCISKTSMMNSLDNLIIDVKYEIRIL